MLLRGTIIDDVNAEAFAMPATRLIVTADDRHWLDAAVVQATGYGTSIIGCDAEAGLEQYLPPEHTPDGRVGAAILFFARNRQRLTQAVQNRTGQGLMTCPTTAVFDGLGEAEDRLELGRWLRFFGDGHQAKAIRHERHGYHIPVMAGEFFCQDYAGISPALAGATVFVAGDDPVGTLAAARRAAEAVAPLTQVITPFPGGVCRCGSKIGSIYPNVIASTHHVYCPTLRDAENVNSKLHHQVTCQYEIVINGLTTRALVHALHVAIHAAAGPGAIIVSSGQYAGKLGDVVEIPFRAITRNTAHPQVP